MQIKEIVEQEFEKIGESSVSGFRIMRSYAAANLYNVFCVDHQGELIAAVAVDLKMEEATELVSILNQPYESDPTLTELVEVEEGNTTRFYFAAK